MVQVKKEEGYRFEKYGGVARFASYAYQIREILARSPESVLEVGAGDKVVGSYVKSQTPIEYHSLDFAADLEPDIVADVRNLPCPDASYDMVCAFEVLEHIPFEDFEVALRELSRVGRTYLLISLPHFGPPLKFLLKVPFMRELRFAWKIPFHRAHAFNGQHYWEIGKKGFPVSRIRKIVARYGTIESEFVPFENQYHHFFVVRLHA